MSPIHNLNIQLFITRLIITSPIQSPITHIALEIILRYIEWNVTGIDCGCGCFNQNFNCAPPSLQCLYDRTVLNGQQINILLFIDHFHNLYVHHVSKCLRLSLLYLCVVNAFIWACTTAAVRCTIFYNTPGIELTIMERTGGR